MWSIFDLFFRRTESLEHITIHQARSDARRFFRLQVDSILHFLMVRLIRPVERVDKQQPLEEEEEEGEGLAELAV